MAERNLSERKKQILKAVVEAHISQGEPVGSRFLMQHQQIALSSATIRNEMAELEAMGYLEQPHTSAGRVPSEAGYRFYVDSLMESYRLTTGELHELNDLVKAKSAQLDQILDKAGRLMSSFTNYTSLALRPQNGTNIVLRYKTAQLDEHTFLLAMMQEGEKVKTQCIHTDFAFDEDMLLRLEEALNQTLSRIPLETVTVPQMMEMESQMGNAAPLLAPVMKHIYASAQEGQGAQGSLKLDGVTRLLEYPEYENIDQLRNLLGSFEKKEDIFQVVLNGKQDGVNVYIGSENPLDESNSSSLIFKTISQGERVLGAIGVIGPRRMDYSKVITAVEYLSERITNMLTPNALPTGEEPKQP